MGSWNTHATTPDLATALCYVGDHEPSDTLDQRASNELPIRCCQRPLQRAPNCNSIPYLDLGELHKGLMSLADTVHL
jgi:hypothetical protein